MGALTLIVAAACGSDIDPLAAERRLQSPRTHLIDEIETGDGPAIELFEYGPGPGLVRFYDVRESTPAVERQWFEARLEELGWSTGRSNAEATSFSKKFEDVCLRALVSEVGTTYEKIVRAQYPSADLIVSMGASGSVGPCGSG